MTTSLIRDNRISSDMATSLINDTAYAHTILEKLHNAARTVLQEETQALFDAIRAKSGRSPRGKTSPACVAPSNCEE